MQAYMAPGWEDIFKFNAMDSFDALWNLPQEWFEAPNYRRKGWSGVSVINLKTVNKEYKEIFVKRQSNHVCKTWRHPFKGIPTFAREAKNLLRFGGVMPTQTLLYYNERREQGEYKSILVTESLSNYISLDVLLQSRKLKNIILKKKIINGLSYFLKKIHEVGIQHNALYPKHIFVNLHNDQIDFRVIDLENAKYRYFYRWSYFRDLDTLNRHTRDIHQTDKIRFLKQYLGVERLDNSVKRLLDKLKKRHLKKKR